MPELRSPRASLAQLAHYAYRCRSCRRVWATYNPGARDTRCPYCSARNIRTEERA